MKASLVAYDGRELYKKPKPKSVKYGYVKGCPKMRATQIGSLEILRVNVEMTFPKIPHEGRLQHDGSILVSC
jgi:hypothetical protein